MHKHEVTSLGNSQKSSQEGLVLTCPRGYTRRPHGSDSDRTGRVRQVRAPNLELDFGSRFSPNAMPNFGPDLGPVH